MPTRSVDPRALQEFAASLGARDPKTVTIYLTTVRDFVAWLTIQPGGTPFHLGLVTETAVRGYMDFLATMNRAPRTRSKALSALRRFCQWAVDEGHLRRNPARAMERPTVVAVGPTELSDKQRFVLKTMVEQHATPRFAAIFALGYWAGLRIGEIAALRLDQCSINQRVGSITLVDAKGGKTRTLDLHNMARRALFDYLSPAEPHDDDRDPESVYVFTSQRAAWLRQQERPDHLSERGIEHLWAQFKRQGSYEEWQLIADVTFHDLRHDFAHRARQSGWSLEEIAVYAGHQTKDGAPAIATTVRYTLPSRKQLKERVQLGHRLNGKGKECMAKVVVLLSPTQRTKLLQIPDNFSEREITRYYSLSTEDLAAIEQHRRPQNRLGFTVQLAYLRFPGRPWDPQEQVPPAILTYLAEQIGEAPDVLADYASRDPTRREHLSEIQRVFHFHPFTMQTYRDLSRWLMPIALSTDQGIVLMEALIEELRARHVLLPAVSTLERLGWETRRRAQQQVFTTLTEGLSQEQRKQLDALLVVATDGRRTPLAWLREPPGPAKPSSFLKVIERLQYIRAFGLDPLLTHRVHANRLRRLAHEGEQYTPQFLERFEPLRRYATLVAYLLDMTATLTDTALEMHDHIMGLLFKQGQKKHLAQFEQRGKAINEKVRLYADVGNALIKAKEEAADPYQALEAVLPWETFVSSVQEARTLARPADFDYLDLLDDHYSHIRKYAPELLETFTFHAAPSSQSVAEALTLVRDLGRKKVPENAPLDFIKPRWESHVVTDDGIDRHYYELCALSELRNGLRSGDIWVDGSHQYRQFEDYLLPTKDWQELRTTGTPPVAVPLDATTYLMERKTLLHEQLTRVGQMLKDNALPDVRIDKNKVRITPLDAEIPEGVEELARRAYAKVRRIKITQLLIEIDQLIHFSRHFTHLHSGERTKDREALFASLLAEATNLGLTKMADATPGVTRTRLSWISDWYVRDECFTKALAEIVNYHHCLPFSANWGDGTTSSSDGQRFPVGGPRSNTAQINAKYGPEPGLVFYTHISDQLDPYRTKVITGTPHEAPHMIDGLLYHETDLDIREHYADTGGYTDQVFSTCHLLGFRFAPRLRDLGDRKLYTIEKPSSYPDLNLLIGGAVNVKQITEHWDELLRLTASLRLGTVTASLMLRKLASYPRQNGLAWALREVGRIEKTLFTLEWLQSLELRRRVQVGLNKGEARNALARAVFFYRQGRVQDRSHAQQQQRAQGFNLVVAAIILWNTLELARAIEELCSEGVEMTAKQLRHLSPMDWEHISLTGDYTWDFTLKNTRP